jgi:hypothetical protein
VTIHLLGLGLSPAAAVALAGLLGLIVGAGLGWLVRDYRASSHDDDCNCDYARGAAGAEGGPHHLQVAWIGQPWWRNGIRTGFKYRRPARA